MNPAETIPKLKRRMDDYIWRDHAAPMTRLRTLLGEHFLPLGPVAIVGGLVRDLARKGKVGFRSDVDLVIDASREQIDELALTLAATPNRFGGFAAVSPHWKIDFWALNNTWAAAVGLVEVTSLADVIGTTFFDCDAICYDIGARKVHALSGYLRRLRDRTLDINLLPNPSVDGNLLRAARRLLLWDFKPGRTLEDFIARELNEESFRRIVATEGSLYQNPILDRFHSAERLNQALLQGISVSLFPSFGKQLELPGFEDA